MTGEEVLEWLEQHAGFAPRAHEFGDSSLFLTNDAVDRNEREDAYAKVFGPIVSVFHELIPTPHHIDVYRFEWDAPRNEHAYVTGGMSDAIQPDGGEFGRIELAFYSKQHNDHFLHLLKSFARYPWETGQTIHPFDTVPLGGHPPSFLDGRQRNEVADGRPHY